MRRHDIQYFLKNQAGDLTPPENALAQFGALIQVIVSVPTGLHQAYVMAGLQVPPPQQAVAMIDTGCTRTAVDEKIINSLLLPPTGQAQQLTAAGAKASTLHPVELTFPQLAGAQQIIPQAMKCDLGGQVVGVLIGTDLLRHFVMIFDGPTVRVTLMN